MTAYTPAIADPELLHGYGAPESTVMVKNTSDISASSVPNSGDDMTDKGDDSADVTVYVAYLVEEEIENQQPEDLLLPAPPLLLNR